jgi:hypothetical protein
LFGFARVEGRSVVASFDGGAMTSDAGALLLGATDRAIGLVRRFASCFRDTRRADLIEHDVATLVGQRVFGIALGYEDLIDHDALRHDPIMAVLAGKLEAKRQDCAPIAGKSTLNRLELSRPIATRYHKVSHNPDAIEGLFVDLFLEAHAAAPEQIILDLDATDDRLHGHQDEQERRQRRRKPAQSVLPWLLRQLLLPAALRVLWPASSGGQAAALEHRRRGGIDLRDRPDCEPDPATLAEGPDPAAR